MIRKIFSMTSSRRQKSRVRRSRERMFFLPAKIWMHCQEKNNSNSIVKELDNIMKGLASQEIISLGVTQSKKMKSET